MAAKQRAAKLSDVAWAARDNPYVRRLVDDDDLRSNLVSAYESARKAYGRMRNGKPAGKALLDDKKLQRELRVAAEALRDAGSSLREPTRRRRRGGRGGIGRAFLVMGVGGILAVALSEGLRSKVLDLLFGKEEEFDYASTTTPATPAPDAVAAR